MEKDYKQIKALIQANLKPGDKEEIARRCGLTAKTLRKALMQDSWEDLTLSQSTLIAAALRYLKERAKSTTLAGQELLKTLIK